LLRRYRQRTWMFPATLRSGLADPKLTT
jgi:hypothetical protein